MLRAEMLVNFKIGAVRQLHCCRVVQRLRHESFDNVDYVSEARQ